MEYYLMTGNSDHFMRIRVVNIGALEELILKLLMPVSGIEKIRLSFALKQARYKTALPLPKRPSVCGAKCAALARPNRSGPEQSTI